MLWDAVVMNWDLAVVVLVPTLIVIGLFTYLYLADDADYDLNDRNRF